MFIVAGAWLAVFGVPVVFRSKVEEGVEVFDGLEVDIAASASIAAVGATFRDEFFSSEA